MDGVLVHEETAIPGAPEFIAALQESGTRFLVLTNNSIFTPRDLRARLLASGIDVPEEAIWTSALATAQFLADQRPGGTAFVVGEAGLTTALHEVGYTMTERDPGLRRPGRDAHLLLRGDHQGDPADRRRGPVHRDQPRRERSEPARPAARHRLRRGPDQRGHRAPALLRRQAQPADDAQCAQPGRRPLRDDRDDRRPDGHRRRRGLEAGLRDRPRADRLDPARPGRSASPTSPPGSSTPSPTSCPSWPSCARQPRADPVRADPLPAR